MATGWAGQAADIGSEPLAGEKKQSQPGGTQGVWKEKEEGLSHRAGAMDHSNSRLSVCCIKSVPPKSCDQ